MILVAALLVLPGLTALQLDRPFRGTAIVSIVVGVACVLAGVLVSALFDVATSGVIVFTLVAVFLFTAAYRRI
jgi:zinc transport system permease protein